MSNIVILGCGYVGSFFLQKNRECLYSKRTKNQFLIENRPGFYFNLNDEESWKNIPNCENILWTFPAANNQAKALKALELYKKHLRGRKVIILSSTSAFISEQENEFIDESFPIRLSEPRFYAETILKKEGALILYLSGIIGPDRVPYNWYLKKRVLYGNNILNYIHVDDIVFFINQLFDKFIFSENFNLTSGDYKTHNEIVKCLIGMKNLNNNLKIIDEFLYPDKTKESKRVKNNKILNYIQNPFYSFKKYPEDMPINL